MNKFVFAIGLSCFVSLGFGSGGSASGYYFATWGDENFVGLAIDESGKGYVLAFENGWSAGNGLLEQVTLDESGNFSATNSSGKTVSGTVNGNLFSGRWNYTYYSGYKRKADGRAKNFAGVYQGTFSSSAGSAGMKLLITPDGTIAGISDNMEVSHNFDGNVFSVYADGSLHYFNLIDSDKMTGTVRKSGSSVSCTIYYSLIDGSEAQNASFSATQVFQVNSSQALNTARIRMAIEPGDMNAIDLEGLVEELSSSLESDFGNLNFIVSDDGKTSGTARFSASTYVDGLRVEFDADVNVPTGSYDTNGNGVHDILETGQSFSFNLSGSETVRVYDSGSLAGTFAISLSGKVEKATNDPYLKYYVQARVTQSSEPSELPVGRTVSFTMPDVPYPGGVGNLTYDRVAGTVQVDTIGLNSMSGSSGQAIITVSDENILTLKQVPLPSTSTTGDFTLRRSGSTYTGSYENGGSIYFVEISDEQDSDGDGIPDLSDSLPQATISLTSSTGGTVEGGGSHNMGNTVTLKATAKAGYRFVSWAGSLAGSDSETVVILSEDLQATALFEKTPITKGWQWSDTFPWVFSEREKNWLYFQAVGNKLKVYSYADGLWRDME